MERGPSADDNISMASIIEQMDASGEVAEDALFRAPQRGQMVEGTIASIDRDGILVDIGRAADELKSVLAAVNYRNLDEEPAFTGRNTTTEFLAHEVFERVVAAIGRGELGAGANGVESIRVTLHESHVASASFTGPAS